MEKRTFNEPHAMKRDEKTGLSRVDLETSEEYRLLEAVGTPRVFYALKANKYFKDPEATKEYTDSELQRIGLPIPAEIEAARRKLIKAGNDAGEIVDRMAVLRATAPQEILPPQTIRDRLVTVDPTDRLINRINRSTLGK